MQDKEKSAKPKTCKRRFILNLILFIILLNKTHLTYYLAGFLNLGHFWQELALLYFASIFLSLALLVHYLIKFFTTKDTCLKKYIVVMLLILIVPSGYYPFAEDYFNGFEFYVRQNVDVEKCTEVLSAVPASVLERGYMLREDNYPEIISKLSPQSVAVYSQDRGSQKYEIIWSSYLVSWSVMINPDIADIEGAHNCRRVDDNVYIMFYEHK